MKRFWIFYGLLPVVLSTTLFLLWFANSTAAAPGVITKTNYMFDISLDSPDPNETLILVNEERHSLSLPALEANQKLAQVAQKRAADMVEHKYYAHKNPDGKYYFDYFKEYKINAGYSCENLDLVFVPDQAMVIKEWMASLKGHRGCMINNQTTKAGYATTKLSLVNYDGTETTAYLVVAIHAELL